MTRAPYRRYRPFALADLVGQEHVIEPLHAALAARRVGRVYLFSGPAGCGKNSVARILARSLTCERGPAPTPCGQCRPCQAVHAAWPERADIVEIDAGMHGSLEDMRDVQQVTILPPVDERFRIIIVDHVCVQEGVAIEPAALSLVVRAGGGSARQTLSVLEQLLAAAGPGGITHRTAAALIGEVDPAVVDEMIQALVDGEPGLVLAALDRALGSTDDAWNLAATLLQRLRDLIILATVPEAASRGQIPTAGGDVDALIRQARLLGAPRATRMADAVAGAMPRMHGDTPPGSSSRWRAPRLCSRRAGSEMRAGRKSLTHRPGTRSTRRPRSLPSPRRIHGSRTATMDR